MIVGSAPAEAAERMYSALAWVGVVAIIVKDRAVSHSMSAEEVQGLLPEEPLPASVMVAARAVLKV